MVDQTNIFEGESKDETTSEENGAFQIPEQVSGFIGEGKKYSDVNKALESIPHANEHISKLEEELAAMRTKLEATTSVEETLKQFTQGKQEQGTPTSQPVDLNAIAKLVDERLSYTEQVKTKSQNVQEVVGKLSEQFGDKSKATEAFNAKAAELGVDVGYLNDLAATSPKAVYTLFGTDTKPKSQPNLTKSSVNTTGLNSGSNQEGQAPGSVMSGASTKDIVSAWRAAAANIKGD